MQIGQRTCSLTMHVASGSAPHSMSAFAASARPVAAENWSIEVACEYRTEARISSQIDIINALLGKQIFRASSRIASYISTPHAVRMQERNSARLQSHSLLNAVVIIRSDVLYQLRKTFEVN